MSGIHIQNSAEGYCRALEVVETEMMSREELLKTLMDPKERETSLFGCYLRTFAWVRSLVRLNGSRHIQAIAAAQRALIELVVDAMLLHHDGDGSLTAQQHLWERSAKLKAAMALIKGAIAGNHSLVARDKLLRLFRYRESHMAMPPQDLDRRGR